MKELEDQFEIMKENLMPSSERYQAFIEMEKLMHMMYLYMEQNKPKKPSQKDTNRKSEIDKAFQQLYGYKNDS